MPFVFPTLPTRPGAPTQPGTTYRAGPTPVAVGAGEVYYTVNLDTVDGSTPPGPYFWAGYGSPTLYLDRDFNISAEFPALNNAGIIWNNSDRYGATAVRFGHVTNSGWIIAESFTPPAAPSAFTDANFTYGAWAFQSLNNSGTILADARGGAFAAYTEEAYGTVVNSGTIAARAVYPTEQALGGAAYGLTMLNSGNVTNTSTGTIYAEGPRAIGVYWRRGGPDAYPEKGVLTNQGLIEAVSTDPAINSIGVRVENIRGEHFTLVNSGTIRAETAIYVASEYGEIFATSTQQSVQTIQNLAGGLIEGDILLTRGNDVLTNAGSIVGLVDMGEGNDSVDTSGGTITGLTDLGLGQDGFIGGTGDDVVRGGMGDDSLAGGGGADLLLGEGNADVLTGGAGNDGLYGGSGNDILNTQAGDVADGGSGDDTIVTGDYTFAAITGGSGHDRWQLAAGSRSLDLGTALAGGRLAGIDEIVLGTSKVLTIHAGNVTALSDSARLVVTSDAGSAVHLVGGWSAGALATVGDQQYRTYTLGGETVLVDLDAAVVLAAPAVAGTGLDAIAAGSAAALPGTVPGTTLSDTVTLPTRVVMENLVIDSQATVAGAIGGYTLFYQDTVVIPTITNFGTIEGSDAVGTALSVGGLGSYTPFDLANHGTIRATATGTQNANALLQGSYGTVHNFGTVEAVAERGDATGAYLTGSVFGSDYSNTGTFRATSTHGFATGIFFYNGSSYTNEGDVFATGGDGAMGVAMLVGAGSFTNAGQIIAVAGPKATFYSVGVAMRDGLVTNTGLISAEIAVLLRTYTSRPTLVNQGDIVGTVLRDIEANGSSLLGATVVNHAGALIDGHVLIGSGSQFGSEVTNRGTITGDVEFGSGNDLYDGIGGTLGGQVFGGAGDDTYRVDSQAAAIVELAGEGRDMVVSTVSFYLQANFEELTLANGAGDLFGVGTDGANFIQGNDGHNLLIAHGGDDAVNGGAGNDQIFGMDGNDTLVGDWGIDYLVGGLGDDILRGADDADALYGEDGDDYLDGGASFHTDILVGGIGNDILYGISGEENPDYDLMDGGVGDDIYWVDTGADLTFEGVGGGIDTVHADVTVPNAGVYLYANVENLVLEGTTAFGVGNELDNVLTGSASGNWLLGGLGADTINGGEGNDVLFGEGGADVFVFGANSGADVIGDFTAGTDRIQLNGLYADFAALSANFAQVGGDGAIYLPGGNLIVLHGVTMSALTAADFIFAPVAEAPGVTDKNPAVMDQPDWLIEPLLADPAELGLQRWGEPFHGNWA